MVEETIQVIRETEAKADAITRDAEVKVNQIVDHDRCKRRRRTGTSRDAVKD